MGWTGINRLWIGSSGSLCEHCVALGFVDLGNVVAIWFTVDLSFCSSC